MSFPLPTDLTTSQTYIKLMQGDARWKTGAPILVANMTELAQLLTFERGNISGGSGVQLYQGQRITVATEPAGFYRQWNAAGAGDALTVVQPSGKTFQLLADTNTVLATTGAPSSGTGANGDYAVDQLGNASYTKTGGAWVFSDALYLTPPKVVSASTYTVLSSDSALEFTVACAVTIPLALPKSLSLSIFNSGSGAVVLSPAGGVTTVGGSLTIAAAGNAALLGTSTQDRFQVLNGAASGGTTRVYRGIVGSQAAMLAVSPVNVTDIVVRSDDSNAIWELTALPATTVSNWLRYPYASNGLPTATTFTTTVPLDGIKDMGTHSVNSAETYTVGATTNRGRATVVLKGDGTNVANLSTNFVLKSGVVFDNTQINSIEFQNEGGLNTYVNRLLGPAASVFDTFTGTDGSLLQAHVGEDGLGWVSMVGDAPSTDITIVSNEVYGVANGSSIKQFTPAGLVYKVRATLHKLTTISSPADQAGIWFRYVDSGSGTPNGYLVRYRVGQGVELVRVSGGTFTTIANLGNLAFGVGETHVLEVRAQGNSSTTNQFAIYWDGALLNTNTDATYTTAGQVGIRLAAQSATTGIHITDFSVYQ